MEEPTLVRDLAVVMAASGAVAAIFYRLKLPVVLGYLLAGLAIGPNTPPFALVSDLHTIEALAELGVILLLFSIGLEFSLRKLRKVGLVAVVVTAVEVPGMVGLGYTVGHWLGWSETDCWFLGAILSVSSTTIIAKALMELGQTQADFARVILGVLIVEDVAAIVMLVLLSGFANAGTIEPTDVLVAIAGVALFATSVTVVGFLVVPWLVGWLASFRVREVLTVSVLGLCFAVAILAQDMGFSVALGAFLIGAVIAETREGPRIEERIEPVRDVFSAVFFVAIGMLIDPKVLLDSWAIVLGLSLLTIAGKVVTCTFGAAVCGTPPRTAFKIGMGLGQIGEFSFIIANLGRSAGVISDSLYPITVAVSAVTTFTTPFQIRYADATAARLAAWVPRPLVEFVDYYDRRLAERSATGGAAFPREARRPLAKLALLAILAVALLVVARAGVLLLHRAGLASAWIPRDMELLAWTAWGVMTIPLLIGLWRGAGDLAVVVGRSLGDGVHESGAVAVGIRFAITVIGALILLAAALPFLPTGVPLAMIALLVGLAALLFRRELSRLHRNAESSLRDLLASESGIAPEIAEAAEADLRALVSSRYPFDIVLEDLVLPLVATDVNRSIQELAIRSRTGATVAAVVRDEQTLANPPPDLELAPGDVIVLLGSRDQVERAMQYLAGLSSKRSDSRD